MREQRPPAPGRENAALSILGAMTNAAAGRLVVVMAV